MVESSSESVTVFIPPLLRSLAGGAECVVVAPGTLREVIEAINGQHTGLRNRLLTGDEIRPDLSVSVNDTVISRGLAEPVPPGCEVHFLPALGGG